MDETKAESIPEVQSNEAVGDGIRAALMQSSQRRRQPKAKRLEAEAQEGFL